MKMKMNDLQVTACKKARGVNFNVAEGTNFRYERAAACKKALKEQIFNPAGADLDADLEDAFAEVETRSEKQKEEQKKEMRKYIERYVHSETRPMISATPEYVHPRPDLEVLATPDLINISVDEKDKDHDVRIEVIKLKLGKPDLTQKAAETDLGLHVLNLYGRALVKEDQKALIVSSYYYLRRKDDKGGQNPVFKPDFFERGGLNVVSMVDEFTFGDVETEIDEKMEPIWDEFLAGKEEEECSEEDCKFCKVYDLCKYKEPPAQVVITKAATKLSAIKLSPPQQEAVDYKNGILRINAGAGGGKTTVVALRVVNLLAAGVDPSKIVLLTFTVPGAEEMRTRIKDYVEDFGLDEEVNVDDMNICTFNAYGNEVLKKEYLRLGFDKVPKVIDQPERSAIIAGILNERDIEGLDYKNFAMENKNCMGALAITKKVFDIIKKNQYGCSDIEKIKADLGGYTRFIHNQDAYEKLCEAYDAYDDKMREEGLIEFTDQEVLLMELLNEDPYYLEQFGYEHIIVDEFQDSNENQIRFLQLLSECPSFKSLMVVGDENQAIYGFRGCTPEYIQHFEDYFGGKVVDDINIMENRRSTKKIIEFANQIAGLNYSSRIAGLIPTREEGSPVTVKGFISKNAEYEYIVSSIEAKIKSGTKDSDIAVICPKNEQLNQIGVMLKERGITTVMLNPEPLLENSRVRAVINFFRFYRDDSNEAAALSFINAAMMGGALELTEKEVEDEISALKKQIITIKKMAPDDRQEALKQVFTSIDFNDDELYQSFVEGLLMKGEKMEDYAMDFLEFGENEKRRRNHSYKGVALTTAHSSKGLEWPIVFNSVTGYDSEELHNSRHRRDMVEEKRRLLFVSCTRARDELYVTGDYTAYGNAKNGYTYNMFLSELYKIAGKKFEASTIEAERILEKERKKAEKVIVKSE